MADFTRKAIRNSFMKLLNEKPLKQITVRDIVDDCGVNRNTFYYHFRDIPQLVETIVRENAEQIIENHPAISSVEEGLEALVGLALENRKAVLHIYRSINRDIYEQYQWGACEHVATVFIDGIIQDRNVSQFDRELLIEYVKCICFGFTMSWLEKGMEGDVRSAVHRLCELKQGELEQMIDRCETP